MAKEYVRWDGFRVKHHGASEAGQFVSLGWLCGRDSNSESDVRVMIFHSPGVGYTYQKCL